MKIIILLLSILLLSINLKAEDSLGLKEKKPFLPHYSILQYAGNMGFLSVGTGYLFNHRRMALGLQVGYLPKSIGGATIGTLTIKYIYSPWQIQKDEFYFQPLNVGLNLTNTYSNLVERKWPSHYPKGYYPIIPSLNFGFFIGSSLYYRLNANDEFKNRLGVFYELAITSRLVELWYDNPEVVHLHNLWNLSLGLKYQFR